MKKEVRSADAPAAIGPYSQAVSAGGFVFVSGQLPTGLDGKLVAGGSRSNPSAASETSRRSWKLRAWASATWSDTVYMTDLSQFPEMNEVYARHFKAPCPARATVEVAGLPKGALIEIDAIADGSS